MDRAKGHFTQEDPIGLAGGMNLYGFAGGDPVTYSDPFGLCQNANGEEVPASQCGDVTAGEGQKVVEAGRASGQWT